MKKNLLTLGLLLVIVLVGGVAYMAGKSQGDSAASVSAAPSGSRPAQKSAPLPPPLLTQPGKSGSLPPVGNSGAPAQPPSDDLTKQMGGVTVQREPNESDEDFYKRVEREFKSKGFQVPPMPKSGNLPMPAAAGALPPVGIPAAPTTPAIPAAPTTPAPPPVQKP